MKSLVVNVTQEDIDAGCIDSVSNCPIALALRRVLPVMTTVSVAPHFVLVSTHGVWATCMTPLCPSEFRADLPKRAAVFIAQFDKPGGKETVEPFSFTINVPDSYS